MKFKMNPLKTTEGVKQPRINLNRKKRAYNLSFAGCGFLGLYHAGVCGCIQEFAPQLYRNQRISGTSAGSIAATYLACDVNISSCIQNLTELINKSRQYLTGPWDPRFKVSQQLMEGLDMNLPANAHEICSGRLHISMTHYNTFENFIATHYSTKEELIKAVICSSFIPGFSGYVPFLFRGQPMIDGGLTKNLLELDDNTITISPFSGDADICPKDNWGIGQVYLAGMSFLINWENLSRVKNVLWPQSTTDLGTLTQNGYNDCLQYLSRKGFIKCDLHRCKTLVVKWDVNRSSHNTIKDDCLECRQHLQEALGSNLSKSVLEFFQSPDNSWSLKNTVMNRIYSIIKALTFVSTQPLFITLDLLHTLVGLLKLIPYSAIQIKKLIFLDELIQQAISDAVECGNSHEMLHQAFGRIHSTRFDNKESLNRTMEGEGNTSDVATAKEVSSPELYVAGHLVRLPPFLQELGDELGEPVSVEVLGSHVDCTEQISDLERGEADGKSDNSEPEFTEDDVTTPNEMKREDEEEDEANLVNLNGSHNLTWTYPDNDDPDKYHYYMLSPIFDSPGHHHPHPSTSSSHKKN